MKILELQARNWKRSGKRTYIVEATGLPSSRHDTFILLN